MNASDIVVSVDDQGEQWRSEFRFDLRIWCIVCRHERKLPFRDGASLQQLIDAGAHECPDRGVPL